MGGAVMLSSQDGQLVQALNAQTLNTQTIAAAGQPIPGQSTDTTQQGQDSLVLNTGRYKM